MLNRLETAGPAMEAAPPTVSLTLPIRAYRLLRRLAVWLIRLRLSSVVNRFRDDDLTRLGLNRSDLPDLVKRLRPD